MKIVLKQSLNRFFGKDLELRVRLFHVLAITGFLICVIMTGVSVAGQMWISAGINLFAGVVSFSLLIYSAKSKRYQFCYGVTIGVIFFLLFPSLFFFGGGYRGGMPFFFVFAVVFTVYMLDRKAAIGITVAELINYSVLCRVAYRYPHLVAQFPSEEAVVNDTIIGMVTVSISLGATMFLQVRMYRRQQAELEEARCRADDANEAKSTFLASMSHEIRTPIHMILGMNEIIHRETRSAQVRDYSEKIDETSKMLLSLVDSVLDVSKIESGKMELMPENYETANLVGTLMLIGRTHCQKKDLRFHADIAADLPLHLYGDLAHIRQIGANFLSNSAKYTSQGSVLLRVWKEPGSREDEILLCISVSDTGIGIREEAIPTLFDAFTRSGLDTNRYIEGTGLGLKIVKELTELMDGTVEVESHPGQGSRFTVRIPQRVPESSSGESQSRGRNFQAPRACVLVVDDNEGNRVLMQQLLQPTKIQVSTAASGAQCLQMVQAQTFDLILMDYMMPEMDGLETVSRLHQLPQFRTPVIALTADATPETRKRLLDGGFTSYLTKPVPWSVLRETLFAALPEDLISPAPETSEFSRENLPSGLEERLTACGIAVEDALNYFDGDFTQYRAMAEVVLRHDAGEMEQIKRLSDPLDCAQLRFRIHAMKGKTRNLGLVRMSALCAYLEQLCAAEDTEQVASLLPYLSYLWKQGSEGLQLLTDAIPAGPVEEPENPESSETPEDLGRLLRQFRRRPTLVCVDRLLRQEPDPEGRKLLRKIWTLADGFAFEQAEAVLDTYLKWKEENQS